MFPFDPSPAISIRAHKSSTSVPFQTISFPWDWSCFIQPGIGPTSANHPCRLTRTDSLPPPCPLPRFSQRLQNEPKELKFRCTKMSKIVQTAILESVDTLAEVCSMTALAGVWKRKREDLRNRRIPLFKRYAKNPNDLRLALEIKSIDDQIAECNQQMQSANRKLELAHAV